MGNHYHDQQTKGKKNANLNNQDNVHLQQNLSDEEKIQLEIKLKNLSDEEKTKLYKKYCALQCNEQNDHEIKQVENNQNENEQKGSVQLQEKGSLKYPIYKSMDSTDEWKSFPAGTHMQKVQDAIIDDPLL